MAPLQKGSLHLSPSWATKHVCDLIISLLSYLFACIWFLEVVFLRGGTALFKFLSSHATQPTRKTGGISARGNLAVKVGSSCPRAIKDGSGSSPLPSKGKSRDQEDRKPSPFDSGKSMRSEYFSDEFPSCSNSTNGDSNQLENTEFSGLRIRDIMSLLKLADYKSRAYNAADNERKEINGLFSGSGLSSLCRGEDFAISPMKGAFATTDSMNFHVPCNDIKRPMEHDELEMSGLKTLDKQASLNTTGPADGETHENKTGTSKQNAGQKVSSAGKRSVSGLSQNKHSGRPNSGSSGGNGGDDGGDDRRPSVPIGSCQADGQTDINNKKKKRKEGQDGENNVDDNDDDDDDDADADGDDAAAADDDAAGDDDEKENCTDEGDGCNDDDDDDEKENCTDEGDGCNNDDGNGDEKENCTDEGDGCNDDDGNGDEKENCTDEGDGCNDDDGNGDEKENCTDEGDGCNDDDGNGDEKENCTDEGDGCNDDDGNGDEKENCTDEGDGCDDDDGNGDEKENCTDEGDGCDDDDGNGDEKENCTDEGDGCNDDDGNGDEKENCTDEGDGCNDDDDGNGDEKENCTDEGDGCNDDDGNGDEKENCTDEGDGCNDDDGNGDEKENCTDEGDGCNDDDGNGDEKENCTDEGDGCNDDDGNGDEKENCTDEGDGCNDDDGNGDEKENCTDEGDGCNDDDGNGDEKENCTDEGDGCDDDEDDQNGDDEERDTEEERGEENSFPILNADTWVASIEIQNLNSENSGLPLSSNTPMPVLCVDGAKRKAADQSEDPGSNCEAVEKAFTCRHNSRAWDQCTDASCQAIQQFLHNTQECRMHVLGGCKQCIQYKDNLQFHASSCLLSFGICFVEKCDDIRRYMKNNTLPDNREWTYQLDQLFFEPSPPRTPILLENQGWSPCFEVGEPGYQTQPVTFSCPSTHGYSIAERSPTGASGVWNQYHVDRPPDRMSNLLASGDHLSLFPTNVDQPSDLALPGTQVPSCLGGEIQLANWVVPCGPATNGVVNIHFEEEEQAVSVSPLSAICMPCGDQPAVGNSTLTRQEVLWPLNRDHLSVGEDGAYIQGDHRVQGTYIGGGSCGRCFLCTDLKTGNSFAIKRDREKSANDNAGGDDDDDDDDNDDKDDGGGGGGDGDSAVWPGGSLDYWSQVYEADGQQWQGPGQPGFDALSAEEQPQSLQLSDLFQSLPAKDLERLVLSTSSGVTDNDINLMTSQEDFDFNSLLDQILLDANVPSHPDGSYSVSDLTKMHIRGSDGNVLLSIRKRPTTTFGSLAKDLHGNIASLLGIEAFALTRDDGSPLDVHEEIGGEEQGVRVIRAHDTDNWQPYRWRVDVHGLVEQTTRVLDQPNSNGLQTFLS